VCCILYHPRAVLCYLPIIKVLAAFIGNMVCVNGSVVNRPVRRPSPAVRPQFLEDGRDGAKAVRGRQKYRHWPSSTVTGRHRAVTINTYTVTVERAVQDITRFIYISGVAISDKNLYSDRADVEGSCFTVKIVEKCT